MVECRLKEGLRTGTHELIVGEVAEAYAVEYFKVSWDFSKYEPLLYTRTTSERARFWLFMASRGAVRKVSFKNPA